MLKSGRAVRVFPKVVFRIRKGVQITAKQRGHSEGTLTTGLQQTVKQFLEHMLSQKKIASRIVDFRLISGLKSGIWHKRKEYHFAVLCLAITLN